MNSTVITTVTDTITEHSLCEHSDRILVGVSGGVDSTVLLNILQTLGYSVAIAHCNFQLRGKESEEDAQFVKKLAETKKIELHYISWDTKEYAVTNSMSIEMAARELRYSWFKELCEKHIYKYIAIAHNSNDTVETFFINLIRGSGIKGLKGIPIKNGQIIRPLLHVSRKEIEDYAKTNNIEYRIDSTNSENIYVRNAIRNNILPEFEKIIPTAFSSIQLSIKYLKNASDIYIQHIKNDIKTITTITNNGIEIDKKQLLSFSYASTLLFEILVKYGFNSDTSKQILFNIEGQTGKKFESKSHTAYYNRNKIIIVKKELEKEYVLEIPNANKEHYTISDFILQVSEKKSDTEINKSHLEAFIDIDKVIFPLVVRKWQIGDVFVPFGMKGKKKISDFLIDLKIPLLKKNNIYVLTSNDEIVWVIGLRISQNFAVSKNTKSIIHFSI